MLAADAIAVATHGASRHLARNAGRPGAYPVATIPPSDTAATAPPGDPDVTGEVQAPAPGLYRYRSTGPGLPGGAEFAERITAAPSPPGTATARVLSTTGIDQTVAFTPGVELELAYSQVGTSVADELSCAEDPPRTLLRLPLRPGATWTSGTACTNFLQDRVREDRQARVVGPSPQTLGGAAIPAWEVVVVATQTTTPARGGPSSTTVVTTTLDISARYGVALRRVTQIGNDPQTARTDVLVAIPSP